MSKPMKLTVTQKSIDEAEILRNSLGEAYRSSCHCPVALEAKNFFPGSELYLGDTTLKVTTGGEEVLYSIPRSVRRFMGRFDRRKSVSPFTFLTTKMY